MRRPPSRRSLLRAGLASGLALFAGCSGERPSGIETTDHETTSKETETAPETEPPQRGTDDADGRVECSTNGHPGGSHGTWRMSAHDAASTRYNPAGEGPTSTVSTRWRLDPPEEAGYTATGPVVNDGTAFVGRGGADTSRYQGQPPWFLLALDAESGAERWRFETGGVVRSPPVYHRTSVFVRTEDAVTALDSDDGTRRWTFERGTDPAGALVPVGETLYLAWNGSLFALSVEDGSVRWQTERADAGWFAVSEDTLFATSDHGAELLAIDAADGSVNWRVRANHDHFSAPSVFDCTIYVGDGDYVRALDAVNGTEQWAFETYGGLFHGPAVDGERVHVAVGSSVFGLDADDGTRRWHTGAERQSTPPSVVGETLYVGDIAGLVRALDAASGEERWRHETARGVFDAPAVARGTVFASDESGTVYALDSIDG